MHLSTHSLIHPSFYLGMNWFAICIVHLVTTARASWISHNPDAQLRRWNRPTGSRSLWLCGIHQDDVCQLIVLHSLSRTYMNTHHAGTARFLMYDWFLMCSSYSCTHLLVCGWTHILRVACCQALCVRIVCYLWIIFVCWNTSISRSWRVCTYSVVSCVKVLVAATMMHEYPYFSIQAPSQSQIAVWNRQ